MQEQTNIFRRLAGPLLEKAGIQALRCYIKYKSRDIFSMVSIETITACNRRCPYCPNSRYDRGLIQNTRKMETGLFYKIIDELAELASAGWAGDIQPNLYGEPLLDERLPTFVRYTRNKLPASPISIFTNGDFLTLELYKELVVSGATRFAVTQHSAEKSANILSVLEYREKQGTDDVKMTYGKIGTINNKGGLIEIADPVRPEKCVWPPTTIGVYYDGNVSLCCHDYLGSVALGNIKNERLIDVWKKTFYRKFRKDVRRGIFNLELCKKCREGWQSGRRR